MDEVNNHNRKSEQFRSKRLVFCFDGTWNQLDAPNPTNVVLTAESVLPTALDGTAQIVYYDEGVGTAKFEQLSGGMFGVGITKNLADAYRHLIFNYMPGDKIYVFGFSRGAYTARSFVGLLRNCGVVARSKAAEVKAAINLYKSRASEHKPSANEMAARRAYLSPEICVDSADRDWRCREFPDAGNETTQILDVAYVGVWDTVGALGVPSRYTYLNFFNKNIEFHDTRLTGMARSARHAVAIDETRQDFTPTLWSGFEELNKNAGIADDAANAPFQQQWFPGVHGSVGGGGDYHGLSDQTLDWIWDGARLAGLELDTSSTSRIFSLKPDFRAPLDNVDHSEIKGFNRFKTWAIDKAWSREPRGQGPRAMQDVSTSTRRRWSTEATALPEKAPYRPSTLNSLNDKLDADIRYSAPFILPAPGQFEITIVKPGDTLRGIALNRYRDADRANEIFDMNKDKLDDPNRIYVGMALRLPA